MLALSSLSKSSRYVGILYAALIFFSEAILGVLRVVAGNTQLLVDFRTFRCESGRRRDFPASVEYDTPLASIGGDDCRSHCRLGNRVGASRSRR